jgi:adenylate cyclase
VIEQRLQQRLRLLLTAPAALVLLIAVLAVTTARTPGLWPREAVFDLYQRLTPRPEAEAPGVAIVAIDEESIERIGPWPWPRTTLAELVTEAEQAGAAAAVVALPTVGLDPLSPEVVSRYWLAAERGQEAAARAIAALPSNDVALAASASGVPTALGVSAEVRPTDRNPSWVRADLENVPWLRIAGEGGTGFLSLPGVGLPGLPEALRGAALPAVLGLPADADGHVRRAGLLYAQDGRPVPAAGLAPFAARAAEEGAAPLIAAPASGRLRVGGEPVSAIAVGDAIVPLDARSELRLWLPGDTSLPSVPAWRVLTEGERWTQALSGRAVMIGRTDDEAGTVETARGPLPRVAVHALLHEQLRLGAVPVRPGWAGPAEGLAALVLGLGAILAAVFLRPLIAGNLVLFLSLLAAGGATLLFRATGTLLDPVPVVAAMAGGQLAVLAMVVGDMLLRDDQVRGAFHGALPPATMRKLQARGGGRLLRGQRRQVTVLSCALRLPPEVVQRFEGRPDDFVRFTASVNDALRRTIMSHQGTVDYAENGQLLGYWNVPEDQPQHVEHACACALKMIDDVNTLSENVEAAAYSGSASMDAGFAEGVIEIGIASGPCFAGPLGVGARNRYAVIGEAVSLATRLRARSVLYGPAIVTDDAVFDALRHHYAFLDLDLVRLDGGEARGVYGLVGNPFLKASKAFRTLADTQRELLMCWRAGDFAGATVQLQRLRALPGVRDAYIDLFDARLEVARASEARRRATDLGFDPAEVLAL